MTRPGTVINIRDSQPPRSAPTDTGVWFVAGLTEKGPLTPTRVASMSDYAKFYGGRVSYGLLYDSLETHFQEGGSSVYVSRVVGTTPVVATRNLLDGSAAISLVVTAVNPGDWANALTVEVAAGVAGGTFKIIVRNAGVTVETSPDLVDTAAAVAWAAYSDWIRLTQGASVNDPAVAAAAALATGTDDRATAVDAHWKTAIDKHDPTLGPGQVSYPGRTTTQAHLDLIAHAAANARVALLDFPDTSSKASLLSAAAAVRGGNARYAAGFWPWALIPGIAAGTTRSVPWSAVQSGIIARNDVGNSPNVAAAGDLGRSAYAIGLSQPAFTGQDREDLNNAGVNVSILYGGGYRTYGYRSLADPVSQPVWTSFGGARLVMAFTNRGNIVLDSHVFDQIDGQGILFAQLDGELSAIAQEFYAARSLFGATPAQAYDVNTGPAVNTPTTIAAKELHASVALRISEMAELVVLDLVRVPVNVSL